MPRMILFVENWFRQGIARGGNGGGGKIFGVAAGVWGRKACDMKPMSGNSHGLQELDKACLQEQ